MKFFFNRKRKGEKKKKEAITVKFIPQPFDYHPKIILAWTKAIEGNEKLLNYLWEHDYKELVMAKHAIFLKQKARDWLMENGYPHFMAMITAAEGNANAKNWLLKNNFLLFYNMAIAIDGEMQGFQWINKNSTQEIFYLTKIIKSVKDEIEHDNNETHKTSKY